MSELCRKACGCSVDTPYSVIHYCIIACIIMHEEHTKFNIERC